MEAPEIAFYRGGQPTAEGRVWMVDRSFKTVIDLRSEDRDNQWTRPLAGLSERGTPAEERGTSGEATLETVHIPVTDMQPPTLEAGAYTRSR